MTDRDKRVAELEGIARINEESAKLYHSQLTRLRTSQEAAARRAAASITAWLESEGYGPGDHDHVYEDIILTALSADSAEAAPEDGERGEYNFPSPGRCIDCEIERDAVTKRNYRQADALGAIRKALRAAHDIPIDGLARVADNQYQLSNETYAELTRLKAHHEEAARRAAETARKRLWKYLADISDDQHFDDDGVHGWYRVILRFEAKPTYFLRLGQIVEEAILSEFLADSASGQEVMAGETRVVVEPEACSVCGTASPYVYHCPHAGCEDERDFCPSCLHTHMNEPHHNSAPEVCECGECEHWRHWHMRPDLDVGWCPNKEQLVRRKYSCPEYRPKLDERSIMIDRLESAHKKTADSKRVVLVHDGPQGDHKVGVPHAFADKMSKIYAPEDGDKRGVVHPCKTCGNEAGYAGVYCCEQCWEIGERTQSPAPEDGDKRGASRCHDCAHHEEGRTPPCDYPGAYDFNRPTCNDGSGFKPRSAPEDGDKRSADRAVEIAERLAADHYPIEVRDDIHYLLSAIDTPSPAPEGGDRGATIQGEKPMTGVDLIARERKRQIEEEGWTEEHDDGHEDGSLALAAVCYAAPVKIYTKEEYKDAVSFVDPWPSTWDRKWDKRLRYGERREDRGNTVPDPETYNDQKRADLLIKAGALIAAELDRLQRAGSIETPTPASGVECTGGLSHCPPEHSKGGAGDE